jgi:hypothetical protein
MRYRKIKASKFRPKHPATRKKEKAATFFPRMLKAAGQHIGTEQLPEILGKPRLRSSRQDIRKLNPCTESKSAIPRSRSESSWLSLNIPRIGYEALLLNDPEFVARLCRMNSC